MSVTRQMVMKIRNFLHHQQPGNVFLLMKVARHTESKGLHEDAIRLYDLCGDYNQTLALLNR